MSAINPEPIKPEPRPSGEFPSPRCELEKAPTAGSHSAPAVLEPPTSPPPPGPLADDAPSSVRPVLSAAVGRRPRQRAAWGLRLATASFFALLAAIAAGVFIVLPRWVEEGRFAVAVPERDAALEGGSAPKAPPTTSPRSETAAARRGLPAAPPPDAGDAPRAAAQTAMQAALQGQEALLASGVELWGGDDWTAAGDRLTQGDRHLGARRFSAAVEAYDEARSLQGRLAARAPEAFREALAAGRTAFAAGDAAAAVAAYQIAVAIDPDDAEAREGLERSRVLDEVRAHLTAAGEHERRDELEAAAERYRRALGLDPLAEGAARALASVEARLAEAAWIEAMSAGFAALEKEDFAGARRAFERAEAARPGTAQTADARSRAAAGLRRQTIAQHREAAERLVANEAWRAAAAVYDTLLEIDPTLRFAQEGRARSLERAALDDRLAFHAKAPERLASAEVLAEATLALDQAAAVADPGPRLRGQIAALAPHVESWARPVTVRFRSDNLTDVTIYRVGRLGTFHEEAMELRPGVYTVVGSRRGYRDVRRRLVIEPGKSPPEPIDVRCEEKI